MTKKIKAIIAIGGTGGHVLPGCFLADHLNGMNYNVELVTDKRGYKYIKDSKNINISTLSSTPLNKKNIFTIFFSSLMILYAILNSLIFLIIRRPSIVFGMGGYASFPICIAATILKIRVIIYENNLHIGKANKYLLPFANKIFVSNKELEGVPSKYNKKLEEIGNIIDKKIISFSKLNLNDQINKLNILVLGGSQAAKVFGDILPNIFRKCKDEGVSLKIFQQCLQDQNEKLNKYYKEINIEHETFNFSNNLTNYFSKIHLAITRSGSSILAELTNSNVPFISIPLPSSADNHQLKNALYYKKRNFAFLIEEKDLTNKLPTLLKKIFHDASILKKLSINQNQYSDKDVYNNINKLLNISPNEKN